MSESLLRTDPRFWVLSEALASYASDRDDPPIHEGDRLQAAVAVIIRARRPLDVLLIKRAQSDRDPWSGHMALPGGRRDPRDADLIETARREAMEETGVDLSRHGTSLGRLLDVAPSSPRLPRLSIASFVFGVPAHVEAAVTSDEVAAVHWVSLDDLRDPATRSEVEIPLPGGARAFPSYALVGEHVWGLTHRILTHFVDLYPEPELEEIRRKHEG